MKQRIKLGIVTLCTFVLLFAGVICIIGGYERRTTETPVAAFNNSGQIPGGTDNTGNGSAGTPYLIGTVKTLKDRLITSSTDTTTRYYRLIADIDLAGQSWGTYYLRGSSVFNGNFYTIKNFTGNKALFAAVTGTIENLYIENVNIAASSNNIAAVAAVANGGAVFNNIEISGKMVGNDSVGGIAGDISGNATITNCINRASVSGIRYIGGMVGNISGGTVTITRSANEGSVTASSINGCAGGIVGRIGATAGATANISWCYSKKEVVGSAGTFGGEYIGGILGRVGYVTYKSNGSVNATYNGNATISNCFSDAEIRSVNESKFGIAGFSNGTLTITDCYFNPDKATSGMLIANVTATTSGPKNTEEISSQDFVDLMNMGQGTPVYVITEGNTNSTVTLRVFDDSKIFMFKSNNGENEIYYIYEAWNYVGDITLPDNGVPAGYTLPAKIGHIFDGWKEEEWTTGGWSPTPNPKQDAGDPFTVGAKTYVTFVAQWRIANFDIAFYDSTSLSASKNPFQLGDSSITLTSSTWVGTNDWKIKEKGHSLTSPWWSPLGSTNNLTLDPINETFIFQYVDYYPTLHSGDVAGYVTIKLEGSSTKKSIQIEVNDSLTSAGLIEIYMDGESTPKEAALGASLDFPSLSTSKITRIKVIENPHYTFVKFNVLDASDNPLPGTGDISAKDYVCDFAVSGSIAKIKLTFEKFAYKFDVKAVNMEYTELDGLNLITYDTPAFAEISGDATVEAIAESASASFEGGTMRYEFVGWYIYNEASTNPYKYDQISITYNQLSLKYDVEGITAFWLSKYVRGTKVEIVAKYVEAYKVEINMSKPFGDLVLSVRDGITGKPSTELPTSGFLPQGSSITVQALPNFPYNEHLGDYINLYEFYGFTGDIFEGEYDNNKLTITEVNGPRNITAMFDYKVYTIYYNVIDEKNNKQYVNDIPTTDTIRVNDELSVDKIEIPNYKFVGYKITDEDGEVIEFPDGIQDIQVTETLLGNNLNPEKNKFVITAMYIRTYELKFITGNAVNGIDLVITVNDKEMTGNAVFERDDDVTIAIKMSGNEYFALASSVVDGIYETEKTSIKNTTDGEGKMVTIKMDQPRTITVKLTALPFDIKFNPNKKGSGTQEISRETALRIGDKVTITAAAGKMNEIKSWVVNGLKVDDKNMPENMERKGDDLVITLTSEWLAGPYGKEIKSSITFGIQKRVMIIGGSVAGVVALLLLAVLLYYISINRTNSRIKAQLQYENRIHATVGAGTFFTQLKEGKDVGNVTKEHIKQAKREEKERKRAEKRKK